MWWCEQAESRCLSQPAQVAAKEAVAAGGGSLSWRRSRWLEAVTAVGKGAPQLWVCLEAPWQQLLQLLASRRRARGRGAHG